MFSGVLLFLLVFVLVNILQGGQRKQKIYNFIIIACCVRAVCVQCAYSVRAVCVLCAYSMRVVYVLCVLCACCVLTVYVLCAYCVHAVCACCVRQACFMSRRRLWMAGCRQSKKDP